MSRIFKEINEYFDLLKSSLDKMIYWNIYIIFKDREMLKVLSAPADSFGHLARSIRTV